MKKVTLLLLWYLELDRNRPLRHALRDFHHRCPLACAGEKMVLPPRPSRPWKTVHYLIISTVVFINLKGHENK